MSEDTLPDAPKASAETPKPAKKTRGLITTALTQHLHAILVGVFTLASSVISALLGYYFAHADRQSMMALEYDKLRAEHTLEIAKALTTAEAHMIAMSVDGSYAASATCGMVDQIKMFWPEVAKAKPLPAMKGAPDADLDTLELHLRSPDIPPDTKDMLSLQLSMLKSQQGMTDEAVTKRLSAFDELTRRLTGDTAATVRIYHRDRTDEFMKLVTGFLQLNTEARQLMSPPTCDSEKKWEPLSSRMLEWNGEATKFSESLGIALKPE